MGYICCLGGFIEPMKSLGGKYEPSKKFRGAKTDFVLIYIPVIAARNDFTASK
jgi:hypothetical protein